MWPIKKNTGEMTSYVPPAASYAVSGHNSQDEDYARDARGNPLATGIRVIPRPGLEPEALRSGTLRTPGRVNRVVNSARPGREALVWVDFPVKESVDRVERIAFRAQDLLIVSSAFVA